MSGPRSLAHSVLDLVGETPLLELHRCVDPRGLRGRLLAKLELLNPAGSKKDRAALEIIRRAKADGALAEGQTVVELTSGNMGAGLAIVCRALGHPFIAVISRGNSIERIRQMRALGADVVSVDQSPGSIPGQVSGADVELVEERANRVVADVVEPAGAAVLAGRPVTEPRHKLQGAGYGRPNLAPFDPSLVTGYLQVTDSEAVDAARHLAAEEGILAGFSTGANLAAAWQLLAGRESGATIAFLACDSGSKYLSTDLFP